MSSEPKIVERDEQPYVGIRTSVPMIGVPVTVTIPGEGRVFASTLPGGRYGTLTYLGDYSGLMDANEALQRWARDQGLRWAMSETDDGDRFASRLEVYLTDPATEPDPEKWETEVTYLLAQD